MDSLTQIILGAAVGEAVLGRKVGNRAMLWGAVGGTIPDLDVAANFFTDEMTAMAFHRGFMHSFAFAGMLPFLVGALVHRLYASGLYRQPTYRAWGLGFWMALYGMAAVGLSFLPVMAGGSFSPATLVVLALGGILVGRGLWRNYYRAEPDVGATSYWDWVHLFFWTIVTHPLLDSCTAYGTQLFQPFSDYRVAFNIISVADPIYTVPFLICLLLAAYYLRHRPQRRWFNWAGIGLSSAYLLFTFYHKTQVNQVFEETLVERDIRYERYITSPTIFNNILWNCVAEDANHFYLGTYSLYDQKPYFKSLSTLPKHHEWLAPYEGQRTTEILRWFSDGYYTVSKDTLGTLLLNDLRFGSIGDDPTRDGDFVFRFELIDENGTLRATQKRGFEGEEELPFGALWRRIRGR